MLIDEGDKGTRARMHQWLREWFFWDYCPACEAWHLPKGLIVLGGLVVMLVAVRLILFLG